LLVGELHVWSEGHGFQDFFFGACEETCHIFLVVLDPTVHPFSYVLLPGVTSSTWTKINDGVTRLGLSRPFFNWQPSYEEYHLIKNITSHRNLNIKVKYKI